MHIYGNQAALTIEDSRTRGSENTPGVHTLMIEIARKQSNANRYDWDNKLSVQLTESEMPQLLSLLMGWQTNCVFGYHGEGRDKVLNVAHQGKHLYVSMAQGGATAGALSVNAADTFAWSMQLLRQLSRNYGGMSSDALLIVLKNTMGRMAMVDSTPAVQAATPQ